MELGPLLSDEWAQKTVDRYITLTQDKAGGLDFNDEQLNRAFYGLQPGIYLLAAKPNIGKTALLIHILTRLVEGKDKDRIYVLYYSLDDTRTQIYSRIIAQTQRIPIAVAAFPKRYEQDPALLARREQGLSWLRSHLDRFRVYDGNELDTIEELCELTSAWQTKLHGRRQVVVVVDNFHDLSTQHPFMDTQEAIKYILNELDRLVKTGDGIPVLCSAELRKINGTRRPIPDDIRESIKLQFKAEAVLLLYNELHEKADAAKVKHVQGGEPLPVLEAQVAKNKLGSFKGRLFWKLFPEWSYLESPTREEREGFQRLVTA